VSLGLTARATLAALAGFAVALADEADHEARSLALATLTALRSLAARSPLHQMSTKRQSDMAISS
jgi:hypothetical protein